MLPADCGSCKALSQNDCPSTVHLTDLAESAHFWQCAPPSTEIWTGLAELRCAALPGHMGLNRGNGSGTTSGQQTERGLGGWGSLSQTAEGHPWASSHATGAKHFHRMACVWVPVNRAWLWSTASAVPRGATNRRLVHGRSLPPNRRMSAPQQGHEPQIRRVFLSSHPGNHFIGLQNRGDLGDSGPEFGWWWGAGHGLPLRGRGGGGWQPGLLRLTHPPTHQPTSEKYSSGKK